MDPAAHTSSTMLEASSEPSPDHDHTVISSILDHLPRHPCHSCTSEADRLRSEVRALRDRELSLATQLVTLRAQTVSVMLLHRLKLRGALTPRDQEDSSALDCVSKELEEEDKDQEESALDCVSAELEEDKDQEEPPLDYVSEELEEDKDQEGPPLDCLPEELEEDTGLSENESVRGNAQDHLDAELRDHDAFDVEEILKLRMENERLRVQLEDSEARGDKLQSTLDRKSEELEEKSRLLLNSESARSKAESSASYTRKLEEEIRVLKDRIVHSDITSRLFEDKVMFLNERLAASENESRRIISVLQYQVKGLTGRLEKSEFRCRTLAAELELAKDARAQEDREEAKRRMFEKARRRAEQALREENERKREEEERKAREKAEREREVKEQKEKSEKLQEEQTWEAATKAEIIRCQERDRKFLGFSQTNFQLLGSLWTSSKALARFELMVDEFESIRFSIHQPLTVENVPWPELGHPYTFDIKDVSWRTVEAFFEVILTLMEFDQYKALVERVHRSFHPDRWRARNLLNTVMDEELRKTLEVAGNTVSQAVTPVWQRSRSRA